jgi:hypothetical protein
MQVQACKSKLTDRFTALAMDADTFQDECVLAAVVEAMLSGDAQILVRARGKADIQFDLTGGRVAE